MGHSVTPYLVIMDEPTLGARRGGARSLYVQITELRWRSASGHLLTHDMSLISPSPTWLMVMYAGQVTRSAPPRRSSTGR